MSARLFVNDYSDPLGLHMFPQLTLKEALVLTGINREFNRIFHRVIGRTSDDIRIMYASLNTWKSIRRTFRRRTASWSRRIYHPDERIIF